MLSMSFGSELDVYGEVVSEGMATKTSFLEKDTEYITVPKRIEENLVVGEEIVVGTNGHLPEKVIYQAEATMYFEESLENDEKAAIQYDESKSSTLLTENSIVGKWDCSDFDTPSKDSEPDDEKGNDEETIATFVTAAGQQLALYAVEDSDEIFAVAVYNESGEPPTSFQFLMKADVERLIGEGAVRTVKKPTQMKKRVLTTQPPMFFRKEDFEEMNEQINDNVFTRDTFDSDICIKQEEDCEIKYHYRTHDGYSNSVKINSTSSDIINTTADKQSDFTYLMIDNSCADIAEQSDECRNNRESEDMLVERSTVQYILFEDDRQSDSELTFDEIQATLQNLKTPRVKVSERDDEKSDNFQDDHLSSIQRDILRDSSDGDMDFYVPPQSTTNRTYSSFMEDRLEDDRQRLIDALTDSPPSTIAPQPQLKVKRPRKQQLTSVNRDDSEIIIQPASILSEEELVDKKRSKRRRGLPSQMRVTVTEAKRMKRTKRREVVEVIDLDADEEEQQTKRNVVEITLDDSKDKYSSDKENEIIMVRDSNSDNDDDEEEEEEEEEEDGRSGRGLTKFNGVMRCQHCSRNFRQQRALDTHLRVCQKSPTKDQQVKKQYTCKVCQEKFDVVVALARHARAEHSQKKKHKLNFSSSKSQDKSLRSVQHKEETLTEEEEDSMDDTPKKELSMLPKVKGKRKQRGNHSWETTKLSCADCGRWFPSSALLDAHSLQHGTKKSEQQLRKCQFCKKFIRSRLAFLRHLKMHRDAQRISSSSSRILRRRLRIRPSARKIASPRKRGRPRKF